MGTNRRYADKIDAQIAARGNELVEPPATLPQQAYGPKPIEWGQARPPVWVWVQWRREAATRVRGYVKGHNDRVCIVWVDGPSGGWEIVVWRQAVSHRIP